MIRVAAALKTATTGSALGQAELGDGRARDERRDRGRRRATTTTRSIAPFGRMSVTRPRTRLRAEDVRQLLGVGEQRDVLGADRDEHGRADGKVGDAEERDAVGVDLGDAVLVRRRSRPATGGSMPRKLAVHALDGARHHVVERAARDEPALVHDADRVGDGVRLVLVVRDVDGRDVARRAGSPRTRG